MMHKSMKAQSMLYEAILLCCQGKSVSLILVLMTLHNGHNHKRRGEESLNLKKPFRHLETIMIVKPWKSNG